MGVQLIPLHSEPSGELRQQLEVKHSALGLLFSLWRLKAASLHLVSCAVSQQVILQ